VNDGPGDLLPEPVATTQEAGGVTYRFPVEIIVIGALTEDDHRAIEERVWTNFGEAFAQSA
jgi:hypothetical protein